MTTTKKIARRKLSLLQLGQEMNNISKACRLMGYSRQQFYEIRRNYQTYGAEGLIDRLPGAEGRIRTGSAPRWSRPSCALPEYPTQGCLRVAQELALQGVQVSSGGVRGVWSRHHLLSKHERLLRLEQHTQQRRVKLSDQQIRLLERFSPEFRDRHIQTHYTGELLGVDTFYVGTSKG